MRLYKPLFSSIIILIQLVLSIIEYYQFKKWRIENTKLDGLISLNITYDRLFIFVLIIGIYEMLTSPSWLKKIIRLFLVCIILGTQFSYFIPIEDFYFGVYNTAWFSAVISGILILLKLVKFGIKKLIYQKQR